MNILMSDLPDQVLIGGESISINTDFRASIAYEQMLKDPEISDEEKFFVTLQIFYFDPIRPEYLTEAVNAAASFYLGQDIEELKDGPRSFEEAKRSSEPCYDFEFDSDLIYAAFWQAYGIDLSNTELHWWKFKALLAGLPEDSKFAKIIVIRTQELSDKMSDEERDRLKELKRIYALPRPEAELEAEDELTRILQEGGDVDEYLRRLNEDES